MYNDWIAIRKVAEIFEVVALKFEIREDNGTGRATRELIY
jgi:hypothetical protein